MHILPARRWQLAAVLTLAGAAASAAELPLIRLSEAQQRSAGLVTEVARAPSADELASLGSDAGLLLNGSVSVPNRSIDVVMSGVAGQLAEVLVDPGQTVRAGQPLGRLYSADFLGLQRDYLQAMANSEVTASRAERDQTLLQEGIVAASRAQESRAASLAAAATLQQQRQLLRLAGMGSTALAALRTAENISPYLTLQARQAGLVLELPMSVGARVEAGQPVFKLAAGTALWLELQATRAQVAELRVGDRVTVPGCKSPGSVLSVGAQLDAGNQTVAVRAQMPAANGCLQPNEYVQASIAPATPMAGVLSLPTTAITRNGNQDYIFARQGDAFQPVAVKRLRTLGQRSWVQAGLTPGTAVASRGVAALKGSWLGLGAAAVDSGQP
jgi:multidrug efflux pump subunit AcrA (membrane-fusion protein)